MHHPPHFNPVHLHHGPSTLYRDPNQTEGHLTLPTSQVNTEISPTSLAPHHVAIERNQSFTSLVKDISRAPDQRDTPASPTNLIPRAHADWPYTQDDDPVPQGIVSSMADPLLIPGSADAAHRTENGQHYHHILCFILGSHHLRGK
jgi:hypothetical protein